MRQWNLAQIEACCARNITPFRTNLLKISLSTLTQFVNEPKVLQDLKIVKFDLSITNIELKICFT